MKNITYLIFLLISFSISAQCKTCNSFEEALKEPNNVISIQINPYIHNIKLNEVPKEIEKFINLEILYLTDQNISKLPSEINTLIKLKELSLGGCKLKTLPNELFELKQLKELILFDNQFSEDYIEEIKAKIKTELPNTKLMI